jgi:hypothetical protein
LKSQIHRHKTAKKLAQKVARWHAGLDPTSTSLFKQSFLNGKSSHVQNISGILNHFNMFIASRGKSIANNGIRSAAGGSEQGQARKKARVEGTGASGTKIESSLRVDVNALRLPSSWDTRHGECAIVRSPIAFENTIGGDGSMDGTGDAAANSKSANKV